MFGSVLGNAPWWLCGGFHVSIMHHTPLPSVGSEISKLLASETRHKSQSNQ